jgi:FKBP-type peptidyl-prolyl cis-trans isomerase SlyD
VESVNQEEPLVFIFGSSGFPEKFENELDGLEEGKSFKFDLDIEEAYGPKDAQAVVRLPKDIFIEDGKFDESKFKPGTIVPMSDADGNIMPSKILEVTDQDLLMDFNHPLAGLDLFFEGKILQVRDATKEEIAHGHVHGAGGHHH